MTKVSRGSFPKVLNLLFVNLTIYKSNVGHLPIIKVKSTPYRKYFISGYLAVFSVNTLGAILKNSKL